MTEGVADARNRATSRHQTLYERWGKGGTGLLITGNVMVDRWHLERPGNIVIDGPQDEAALTGLRALAAGAKADGSSVVMQISHAGRQTQKMVNRHPKSASDVGLAMGFGRFARPTPMTQAEIEQVIAGFVHAARAASDTGFDGVQVHGAHGYLLSQFLSPLINRRTDEWGGPLENRARLLLEIVRQVRAACPPPFILAAKLNSADFQRGGFDEEDSVRVAAWLAEAGCDLIEISGGNYEQPRMFDMDRLDPLSDTRRESTRKREAYFLDFVPKLRAATDLPLMITGGFRSPDAMAAAVEQDGVDVIGLARPLLVDPDASAKILSGQVPTPVPTDEELAIGRGIIGLNCPISAIRDLNGWSAVGWYFEQVYALADGRDPNLSLSPMRALLSYDITERRAARALHR